MKYLFVHNNFPAQFRHLAVHLASDPRNEVRAIGADGSRPLPGVVLHRYTLPPGSVGGTHPFARRFDGESRRAEQALYVATMLRATGFRPDIVVAHSGWGEAMPLRAVFPEARLVAYCEYFYRSTGSDVNFDPEFPALGVDGIVGLHARNAANLLALVDCDFAIAPTEWQRSTFPAEFHAKIRTVHEGIDTRIVAPDPAASIRLDDGTLIRAGDEVVTFVARNLEPLRGYHVFMRALPEILRARPQARVLIVGGFGVSYGQRPPPGETWHRIFLDEVAPLLDTSRVHFLGHVPFARYLDVLRVSRAHAYLTYPFVLSWSCLEAMAAGCVVVASDTAPVREVIDASNGILVPFHRSERLAEALIAALADPDAHAELGSQARRTILERYDMASVCLPQALRILHEPGPASSDAVLPGML
ncbi:glycosyltransferase [Aureimonas sp. AU12]|uniref:glycosyltransferase n=1 Tax=Aureimonas sp. AU12 TaxID=1638161 RepID=UPI0007850F11|nr:glycosyltransferase [Aureimonas sp. AU12]